MVKFKTLMFSLLLAGLAFNFTSCTGDDPVNESLVLAEYMESANSPLMKDYVNTDLPSIMTATDVNSMNLLGTIYIIDVRLAADYATGHIQNAVNVAFADLLTHVQGINMANYEKVAIVCYSGQTAAYGASILRLMGYDKVFSMKWGMCSWNETFAGSWNSNISNMYATQFTSDSTSKNAAGELPTLETGKTTGQEILEARIATLLSETGDPWKITKTTVFENPSNYYIINYWPLAQYLSPGHIPGAIQYTPKETIKLDAALKTLPTDKTIVVYCYTGQTSAFLTAYLRLLGYDAKSLMFGGNGMIYDMMQAASLTTWSTANIMGYEVVQ